MDKKTQRGMTASLKQAVKGSSKSSAASANNHAAFKRSNSIDSDNPETDPEDMSSSGDNRGTFLHSPPFTKDSISAEKCSQLSPAKKLPSSHGNQKRPATVALQIYDVMYESGNNGFGQGEGAKSTLEKLNTRRSSDVIDTLPPPRHRSITFSDAAKASAPERQSLGTSVIKGTQNSAYAQHKIKKANNTLTSTATATATRDDNHAQCKRNTSKPTNIDIKICQQPERAFQDQNSLLIPGDPGPRRHPHSPFPTKAQLAARSPVSTPGTEGTDHVHQQTSSDDGGSDTSSYWFCKNQPDGNEKLGPVGGVLLSHHQDSSPKRQQQQSGAAADRKGQLEGRPPGFLANLQLRPKPSGK
ncbi:hypothetical protein PISL3812_08632 [Talaromyces islandicus]|uniref:Uncharacterized protein n=1 Tax=Talaromyces islandicus TaxID=28573 RepID=A0A0U1M896_TALIS|nr:hypothetical protein PISL3812_08632 [Talaromyces islandicus]